MLFRLLWKENRQVPIKGPQAVCLFFFKTALVRKSGHPPAAHATAGGSRLDMESDPSGGASGALINACSPSGRRVRPKAVYAFLLAAQGRGGPIGLIH